MNIFATMAAMRAVFWLTVACFTMLLVGVEQAARKSTDPEGLVIGATMKAIKREFEAWLCLRWIRPLCQFKRLSHETLD